MTTIDATATPVANDLPTILREEKAAAIAAGLKEGTADFWKAVRPRVMVRVLEGHCEFALANAYRRIL